MRRNSESAILRYSELHAFVPIINATDNTILKLVSIQHKLTREEVESIIHLTLQVFY